MLELQTSLNFKPATQVHLIPTGSPVYLPFLSYATLTVYSTS